MTYSGRRHGIERLIEQAPKIIEAAARSPLGILALMVMALALVGVFLFQDAAESIRRLVFILLFVGVVGFAVALMRGTKQASYPSVEGEKPLAAAKLVQLRHEAKTLSSDGLRASLVRCGLFDQGFNPGASGITHQYEQRLVGDVVLIADHSCGLLWQSGASQPMTLPQARLYLNELNARHFAGYSDWRLPTAEEGASLLEPEPIAQRHIDPIFEPGTNFIWTGDEAVDNRGWVVYFYDGQIASESAEFHAFVRVVRTP